MLWVTILLKILDGRCFCTPRSFHPQYMRGWMVKGVKGIEQAFMLSQQNSRSCKTVPREQKEDCRDKATSSSLSEWPLMLCRPPKILNGWLMTDMHITGWSVTLWINTVSFCHFHTHYYWWLTLLLYKHSRAKILSDDFPRYSLYKVLIATL